MSQPANTPVRVLIVDAAALMRATIRQMLSVDPRIEVICTAGSGVVALQRIKELRPDVVTLDVEMPGMDGIEVLKRLMVESPVPVVMLSSHTRDGAQRTFDALEAGGTTIAQDADSCVVFGMPKAAIAKARVQHVVPLERLMQEILDLAVASNSGPTTTNDLASCGHS